MAPGGRLAYDVADLISGLHDPLVNGIELHRGSYHLTEPFVLNRSLAFWRADAVYDVALDFGSLRRILEVNGSGPVVSFMGLEILSGGSSTGRRLSAVEPLTVTTDRSINDSPSRPHYRGMKRRRKGRSWNTAISRST